MPISRILAQATVDHLRPGPVPLWEITVNGQPPFEHRRVYILEMRTEDLAAQEGLRLFEQEMENLQSQQVA